MVGVFKYYMYNTKRGIGAYKQTRVTTASQSKLVVMLYDEAIKQLKIAVEYMENEDKLKPSDISKINKCLNKVLDIIGELSISLDFERGGDIARNLYNLYTFFTNEIIQSNISKKVLNLREVIRLMLDLREAWNVIDINFSKNNKALNNVG